MRLDVFDQFLDDYPGMAIVSRSGSGTCLRGKFRFRANVSDGEEIEDCYQLEIYVPENFPHELIRVKETANKIPNNGDYHVNPDGTLCLGSSVRLLIEINHSKDLSEFAEKCLIPHLYAVSVKLRNGGELPFGELKHGKAGLIDDYSDLFGISDPDQVARTLILLGMKKQRANKRPCPCGCGKRLGKCKFHLRLNEIREMATATWFKERAMEINPEIAKKRRV